MRPMITGAEPGGGNLTQIQSWEPAAEELWNAWEIHSLILVSLFLQVFLFLFADRRKSGSSSLLRKVLWLAYLSADSVAVFVLGHLAAHARSSEPREQRLVSFWAPFVLVHLGGQETMTAFSMQDNELWTRHLLNLVIQAAVAGYVVGKASWPDRRLMVAMVLIFISGVCKYGGRTLYLFFARPKFLTSTVSWRLYGQGKTSYEDKMKGSKEDMKRTLDRMLRGSSDPPRFMESFSLTTDIMAGDAPLNTVWSITLEGTGELPDMLAEFRSHRDRHNAYEHVAALLEQCYSRLYTKGFVRGVFADGLRSLSKGKVPMTFLHPQVIIYGGPTLFPYVAAPIALALFVAAEKGEPLLDSSRGRADITVSYLLLVGAIVLDVLSAASFIFSRFIGSKKKQYWCQHLGQYNMIDNVRHKGERRCFGLLPVTTTPITVPTKEFILDTLLDSGTRREWHIASTRGKLALLRGRGSNRTTTLSALEESVRSGVDFPRSVLIWHIATDICFHHDSGDKNATTCSYSDGLLKKQYQQIGRELSNYIMYLVFDCRVMLTTHSNVVHDDTRRGIAKILSPPPSSSPGKVVNPAKLLLPQELKVEQEELLLSKELLKMHHEGSKEQDEITTTCRKVVHRDGESKAKEQDEIVKMEMEEHDEEMVANNNEKKYNDDDDVTAKVHMKKLRQSAESLYSSPVLPRASEVAQELITIKDEAQRWELIATVWAEMLYYTAPRCGAAFHAEHLATGGEFVTHVFVLMYLLGPFMPPPAA